LYNSSRQTMLCYLNTKRNKKCKLILVCVLGIAVLHTHLDWNFATEILIYTDFWIQFRKTCKLSPICLFPHRVHQFSYYPSDPHRCYLVYLIGVLLYLTIKSYVCTAPDCFQFFKVLWCCKPLRIIWKICRLWYLRQYPWSVTHLHSSMHPPN